MMENSGIVADPADSYSEETGEQVAKYLQGAVGKALAEGVAATIKAKPEEPPLFLSRWLLRYVEESKRRLALAEAQKASCAFRAGIAARLEAAGAAGSAAISHMDERCLNASDREILGSLRNAEWIEQETINGLLNHLRERLGATGVYLAKYDEQAALREGEVASGLRYIAADQDHYYMLSNCLFEDEGVTWDLLHEEDTREAAIEYPEGSEEEEDGDAWRPRVDGQEKDPGASGGSTEKQTERPIRHRVLAVEEVMDNPRIRFFGLTRPGSYAAVSLEFSDVANTTAVSALCAWMQQSQRREEAIAAGESTAGSSEGEENGAVADGETEEDEETEADEPLPSIQLPSTTAKYILCVDFLGKPRCLGEPAIRCIKAFAEEIAEAFLKTQREAVERQAEEMLSGTAGQVTDEELVQLQQNSAKVLEALEEQRQAEALRLFEEEEAEEAKQREMLQRERKSQLQNERACHTESDNQPRGDEDSGGEEEHDEDDEPPPLVSRELVLDAASASAALQAFNEQVLSPLKQKFSLSRRYIADSSALVSAAAACALLLGHDPLTLREKAVGTETQWSWDRLRRLLTPSFADAMLVFDPKAPRHYTESISSVQSITELLESKASDDETQLDSPFTTLLTTWASVALSARRKELLLQRARLRRTSRLQHAPPSNLDELDSDFKYLAEEG